MPEIDYDGADEKPDDIDDVPRPLPTPWATAERILAARRGTVDYDVRFAATECGTCGWELPHHEFTCAIRLGEKEEL